jgi:hypothetical protein
MGGIRLARDDGYGEERRPMPDAARLVTAKELEAFPPGDFGFELVEGRSVPQRRARRGGHRRPSEAVTVYRQSGAPSRSGKTRSASI